MHPKRVPEFTLNLKSLTTDYIFIYLFSCFLVLINLFILNTQLITTLTFRFSLRAGRLPYFRYGKNIQICICTMHCTLLMNVPLFGLFTILKWLS